MNNPNIFKTTFAGRPLVVETNKTCELSNGSCWVRYGDTVVMANVTCSSKPRENIDFLPLSVDYEERLYSVGKIPGSFLKREGRPSEKAILNSRLVDRPIRPLFSQDIRNDIAVVITVLASDVDNPPEITGMIATSIALSISDIPWNGPIGGVNIGLIDNEIILNPVTSQREKTDLNLTIAATEEKIVMIEAGANEVPENIMIKAIKEGHQEIIKIVKFIRDIQMKVGKPKFQIQQQLDQYNIYEQIKEFALEKMKFALDSDDKNIREKNMSPLIIEIHEMFDAMFPEQEQLIDQSIYKLQKYIVRDWLKNEKRRVDGREIDQIRELTSEVSVLPRVHGSGIFTRGQTQVLSVATLGPIRDAQVIDGIDEDESKRYMHHYNFPSYSVGETRPNRGPGRREIGHGALAERAIEAILPSINEFPYAIRVVSEVLSSNGSTSQGAICGSTLALMDAGVPIKAPVAGISCGLIADDPKNFITILDIQGLEDFFGDMDFKVAGSKKGITAIQVDIKIDGLSYDMIIEAFEKTRKAREYIIDNSILKCIPEYRNSVSEYAPKLLLTKINVDKIRDVIGTGGKVIQKICTDYNVKIDISDNGDVFIMGSNEELSQKALQTIETIVHEPKVGNVYNGKVQRIMPFGAFVEFISGKEGLVHISKLENKRVEKVEDIVSIGDIIPVKIIEIDSQGRINLSRKDAIYTDEPKEKLVTE